MLSQRNKEAAAAAKEAKNTSRLSQEYTKLVNKMNEAGKSVQNLTAKKAQGKRLSDLEQKELTQSTIKFTRYNQAVMTS